MLINTWKLPIILTTYKLVTLWVGLLIIKKLTFYDLPPVCRMWYMNVVSITYLNYCICGPHPWDSYSDYKYFLTTLPYHIIYISPIQLSHPNTITMTDYQSNSTVRYWVEYWFLFIIFTMIHNILRIFLRPFKCNNVVLIGGPVDLVNWSMRSCLFHLILFYTIIFF